MLITGIFNLACGITDFGGAKRNIKKLNTAFKLGWIGLILSIISAGMTIMENVSGTNIVSVIYGCIIPVFFLISVIGTRNQNNI